MVVSAIIHFALIIIFSICVAIKPEEASPKLLHVSLKNVKFEENKTIKEDRVDIADKRKLDKPVSKRSRMIDRESADISTVKPCKGPSVSPEIRKEKKREIIETKTAAVHNDVSRVSFIIDFSFSSNDIKKAFFQKYDIIAIETFISEYDKCGEHAYYEIKYGDIPGIYVGGEYVYLWSKSVNSAFWEKIGHFLAVRKLVVMLEIDEKKLEFRVKK
jgi:hypothetical protein